MNKELRYIALRLEQKQKTRWLTASVHLLNHAGCSMRVPSSFFILFCSHIPANLFAASQNNYLAWVLNDDATSGSIDTREKGIISPKFNASVILLPLLSDSGIWALYNNIY